MPLFLCMRDGEELGPTAFAVLFMPCLWMLLQVLPISIRSLANPVWMSASTTLDSRSLGP